MKKFKTTMLVLSFAVCITGLFSFNPPNPCSSVRIGYISAYTPNGTPPNPSSAYRLPGELGSGTGKYVCISTGFCRYVYYNGLWHYCSGTLTYN